jgi:hypothetical protein
MKKFLLPILSFTLLSAHAEIKTVVDNAQQGWGTASNWSPSGVPVNGDEVIIPLGKEISVKGSFYAGNNHLVIKVYGILDFDPSGKLDLGASSQVHLYTNSARITTNGTGSELIIINGVIKFNGNVDGNITGPRYAVNSAAASPNGFFTGVLPVKLSSFTARQKQHAVVLNWLTNEETNSKEFVVERSENGAEWKPISSLRARGTGSAYMYVDESPLFQMNYYRLKAVDQDGSFEYSDIIKVNLEGTVIMQVGPNPASGYIKIAVRPGMNASVDLIDGNGQKVKTEIVNAQTGTAQIQTAGLAKGQYYVMLIGTNGIMEKKPVIIQ